MSIQKRRRGRNSYFYLVYSYRKGQKVRKVERYLGRKLPASLTKVEEELAEEAITEQWGTQLEGIRTDYSTDLDRMPPVLREQELNTFAINFTYASNRIEGSSLTRQETAALLEHGITPSNRPLSDVQESLAHRKVFLAALSPRERLDRSSFFAWHRALFQETKPEYAGLVRQSQVQIRGSRFIPPAPFEIDLLLDEFFRWLPRAWKSLHPVVLAALVHLRLVTIHPFADGNGRVTRIAMNFVLYRKGYPMLNIPYERRAGYYRALERAQTQKDEFVFVRWVLRRYLRENTRLKARPVPRRSVR